VPAAAFKETALATFDPSAAALVFETSGTTQGRAGRHYMESPALYDAALLAAFDRFVLSDGLRLEYLNLVADPTQRQHSSLGYMMGRIAQERGNGRTGWYLRDDELLLESFWHDLAQAVAAARPVCIAATAFALVHVCDAMARQQRRFTLPQGSRVMETGGFKGRTRTVQRAELYASISECLGIPRECIVAEYGMTELTSQYYCASSAGFIAPPWMRTRVVGPQRTTLAPGETGALLHVDLANRSSCLAIQTEDLGSNTDEGLMLHGRDPDASLRGCSLDAEDLQRRTAQLTART